MKQQVGLIQKSSQTLTFSDSQQVVTIFLFCLKHIVVEIQNNRISPPISIRTAAEVIPDQTDKVESIDQSNYR